ncbi:unnamed protein product [Withania somnifera]
MVLVQKWTTPYLPNALSQVDVMHRPGCFKNGQNRRAPGCVIRSENVTEAYTSSLGRRQFLSMGPTIVPLLLMTSQTPASCEDKVFKDVIEPLESVSVNVIPRSKEDIRDFGSPQQRDVDGKTYYTFEFTAQAPNYVRYALTAVCVGNGKFYTLTTGANERRWEKMKDRLHTMVDSFQIFNV